MCIIKFWRACKRAPETVLYAIRRSFLPENGTYATPFLSDVYNNSTRARKRLAGVSLYAFRWLPPQNVTDTTLPDDDVYNLGTCRKTESAGNGLLSSGEKNFSVHKTYMNFLRPRKRAQETALYALRGSLLPENGTNAKPFLSDVYNNSTRARKRLAGVSLYGRSMVEMLGVLAIIGVLSVGAISGYQKAMMKYKLNKQTVQISTLLSAVSRYQKDLKLNDGSTDSYSLIPFLKKLNEIPTDMYISGNDSAIQDALNNTYEVYSHFTGYVGILTWFNNSNSSIDSCKNIFMAAKEYSQNITNLQIGKITDGSYSYTSHVWGENYCSSGKRCLKDLNIMDTEELCRVCDGEQMCVLYLIWW